MINKMALLYSNGVLWCSDGLFDISLDTLLINSESHDTLKIHSMHTIWITMKLFQILVYERLGSAVNKSFTGVSLI